MTWVDLEEGILEEFVKAGDRPASEYSFAYGELRVFKLKPYNSERDAANAARWAQTVDEMLALYAERYARMRAQRKARSAQGAPRIPRRTSGPDNWTASLPPLPPWVPRRAA